MIRLSFGLVRALQDFSMHKACALQCVRDSADEILARNLGIQENLRNSAGPFAPNSEIVKVQVNKETGAISFL